MNAPVFASILFRSRVLLFVAGLLAVTSCSIFEPLPRFALPVPSKFNGKIERREFRRGESFFPKSIYKNWKAEIPTVWLAGQYPNWHSVWPTESEHGWFIEVQRGVSPKLLRALESAKDGYEADLGHQLTASPAFYARFTRKQFKWGSAVCFLVQYQCDIGAYGPNNDMLDYEVHGVTSDHRYSVRALFSTTHPQLIDSPLKMPKNRIYKADDPIRHDPGYVLIEQCPDTAFRPSITEIDAMLDGLKFDASK
jgi:hypothetical protein